MKKLYVIAGCNGAGKTTASYTILPEILECREFVNADEIARGLSPFQPEKVGIEAGRLMLKRIKQLLAAGENFAFETTLATKSYAQLLVRAQELNYQITCLYFWLHSEELAISRVATRVKEGGHHIEEDVIRRRYKNGLKNFFSLFLPIVDNWIFIDNSLGSFEIVADGKFHMEYVYQNLKWHEIKQQYYGKK